MLKDEHMYEFLRSRFLGHVFYLSPPDQAERTKHVITQSNFAKPDESYSGSYYRREASSIRLNGRQM